jgi:hypothetical protein
MSPANARTAPAREASTGARLRIACCLALVFAAGCFTEVQPAKPEFSKVRIFVSPVVVVTGNDVAAAVRDGLDRDLRSHLEGALDRAGFQVASRRAGAGDFTARLSVQLASHHLGAGTVGTVRLLLRDEQGRGVDGATASAGDRYTYSTTAFADRATAALATQLGQSPRLSEVLRH